MTKVLKVIPLLVALVLLATIPAIASAETKSSVDGSRIMAQQGPPSVSMSVSPDAKMNVRLNLPVSVTAMFSEPVSGFTLGDIRVVNGTASGLSGSDGDDVYMFEVTPTSLGKVTVDIAAGVATNGEGTGNTPAPQLSLGIPYDFDGTGGISRAETIAAIRDYFDGNINRGQAIAVIRFYFSPPAEPEPGISDDCIQTVSSDGTLNGQWASGCDSETLSGSHARYYTFTLDASSEVTVRLESSAANAHLYLRRGGCHLRHGAARERRPRGQHQGLPDTGDPGRRQLYCGGHHLLGGCHGCLHPNHQRSERRHADRPGAFEVCCRQCRRSGGHLCGRHQPTGGPGAGRPPLLQLGGR